MSLIFPDDLGVNAKSLNYMSFQPYTITGGVGSAKSDRKYEMVGEPVYLPIPVEGVQDQMSNNWNANDVNFAQMTAGVALSGAELGAATSSLGLLKRVGEATKGGLSSTIDKIMNADAESTGEALKMVTAKGVSQGAVGLLGETIGNAAVQASGIAGMDQTSIVYTGPQFRNFSFSFSLKPLTQSEQMNIEAIVGFFKEAASPREIEGALYRIYSLPKVFQIKFFNKNGESNSLPRLGKCALQNIGIKYGGDRFQTFATGHAPVQTDISLQFIELILQTNGPKAGRASTAQLGPLGMGALPGEMGGMMGTLAAAGGNMVSGAAAAINRVRTATGGINAAANIASQKAQDIMETNVNK